MSMLIPFWVWVLLGIFVGWKLRGFFGNKLSFLGKIRRPFGPKKPKRKSPPTDDSDPGPEKEKTVKEKAKSALDKVTGVLAKPTEWIFGRFNDEEDDDE